MKGGIHPNYSAQGEIICCLFRQWKICHDWIKGSIRVKIWCFLCGYSIWIFLGLLYQYLWFLSGGNNLGNYFGYLGKFSCTYRRFYVRTSGQYFPWRIFWLNDSVSLKKVRKACTFLLLPVQKPEKQENYVSFSSHSP